MLDQNNHNKPTGIDIGSLASPQKANRLLFFETQIANCFATNMSHQVLNTLK